MSSRRLPQVLRLVALPAALLAGCGAESPVPAHPPSTAKAAATVRMATTAIDPAIPALTVVGRRMSAAEKLAYDRDLPFQIASATAE